MLTNTAKSVCYLALTVTLIWMSTPVSAQIKILPVGDSITAGFFNNHPAQSYRRSLAELLSQGGCAVEMVGSQEGNVGHPTSATSFEISNGFSADIVLHEGYAGHRADHFLNGFAANPGISTTLGNLADLPDAVLIHLGTNDMNWDQDPAATVEEIEEIVDRIVNSNLPGNQTPTVFVANLIPWYGYSSRSHAQPVNVQAKVEVLSQLICLLYTSDAADE